MTTEPEHQTEEQTAALIKKHLETLFDEAISLEYCMLCVTESVLQTMMCTFLANTEDTELTIVSVNDNLVKAIMAVASGEYTETAHHKPKRTHH